MLRVSTFIVAALLSLSTLHAQSKLEAQFLYDSLYGQDPVSIPWTGSVVECEPGVIPDDILLRARNRVNYFRVACGLAPIAFKAVDNQMAQAAALMMAANKELNHAPPENWDCYSRAGAIGAEHSNLGFQNFLNYGHNAFITGFMRDWGARNYYVGHRRWILYTRSLYGGYGSTGVSAALFVVDSLQPTTSSTKFIAYPPPGYFPASLVFPKWSFALPEGRSVDFSRTKIIMTNNKGRKIKLTKLPIKKILDPCISWRVDGFFTEEEIKYQKNSFAERSLMDQSITVEIREVVIDGKRKNFSYKVIPFKAKED